MRSKFAHVGLQNTKLKVDQLVTDGGSSLMPFQFSEIPPGILPLISLCNKRRIITDMLYLLEAVMSTKLYLPVSVKYPSVLFGQVILRGIRGF